MAELLEVSSLWLSPRPNAVGSQPQDHTMKGNMGRVDA